MHGSLMLERLRTRGLGRKRSLAQREFALGVEALERTVRGEPLYKVHEAPWPSRLPFTQVRERRVPEPR